MQNNSVQNAVQYFRAITGATDESIAREREYDNKAFDHVEANNFEPCAGSCQLCDTYGDIMRDVEGK